MKVLALDTSNRPLSVAAVEDQQVLANLTTTVHRRHSGDLLPIVARLISSAGWQPQDLDRVVVASGPGSYTGIRIACTTAKVLAFTLGIKLVSVSSLRTLALNVRAEEGALVDPVFDARNNNVYTGLYQIKNQQPVSVIKDQHVSIPNWIKQLQAINAPIIGVGDADHFRKSFQRARGDQFHLISGLDNLPQAAELGIFGENQKPVKNIDHFIPNYLRLTRAQADWWKRHPDASKDPQAYVDMYQAKVKSKKFFDQK